jgi:hypothetical protein
MLRETWILIYSDAEGDLDINIQSCPHICGLRQPEKKFEN